MKLKKIILGININEIYKKNQIEVDEIYFNYDFYDKNYLFDHEHCDGQDSGEIKFLSTRKMIEDENVIFFGLVLEIGKEENWYDLKDNKCSEHDWYGNEDFHEIPLLNIDEAKINILEKVNKLLPFLTIGQEDVKLYYIPR